MKLMLLLSMMMVFVKHTTYVPVPRLKKSVFDIIPQVEIADASLLTRSNNLRWVTFLPLKKRTTSVPITRLRRSVFDVIPQVEISDTSLITKSKSLRWVTFLHGKNGSLRSEDSVTQRRKEKLKNKFS